MAVGTNNDTDHTLTLLAQHAAAQTPAGFTNMTLPSVSQISNSLTATPRTLVPWASVPQMSNISTLPQENFELKPPLQLEDGQATRSYPSPLSTTAEPSYEDDRQVKEKVRLRCFGPTCPLHVLLRPGPPDPVSLSGEMDSCLPSLDSEQFQKELLNIFWDFQPLSITIVHKETFMEHFLHGIPGEYFSEFLLNCILACAVRLSTRTIIRGLSTLYIKRAKAELVNALEQATIATLQGFCLLSDFEMSSGRDQAGWLYTGMPCVLIKPVFILMI
jgi:hypothetical protein